MHTPRLPALRPSLALLALLLAPARALPQATSASAVPVAGAQTPQTAGTRTRFDTQVAQDALERVVSLCPFLQEPVRNPNRGLDDSDNPGGRLRLHSGELVLQRTDLSIRGRRMGFRFMRTYRSSRDVVGPLGPGWSANVFMRLDVTPSGHVIHFDGTGRRYRYVSLAGGVFISPRGHYRKLIKEPTRYRLRNRDGTKHTFDLGGRLLEVVDRAGNRHEYQYDVGGQLETIVDEFGREIDFVYDGNGRLETITDFTSREVRFTYDAAGRLTEARSPLVIGTPNGNDFPSGRRERYVYDAALGDAALANNLTEVIAPNEVEDARLTPHLQVTYGGAGCVYDRVTRMTVGGTNASGIAAGGELRYRYCWNLVGDPDGATSCTRVTDRNGTRNDYFHDQFGHAVRVVEDACGPTPFVTRFAYNGDGEITRKVLPMGNETRFAYDAANPDRFQQGNLLEIRRIPDAARGGDQDEIVTSFTYEPFHNQVLTRTEPRGNDVKYVPQNGGSQSAARYARTTFYDWQEGVTAPQEATDFGIAIPGDLLGLGDLNGDGLTDQVMGNRIRWEDPTVTLLPGSEQAAVEGDTSQEIVTRWRYNVFGQLIEHENPRGNIDTVDYFSEEDPDGDGLDLIAGRNATTGGYPRERVEDAFIGPNRQDTAPLTSLSQSYDLDRRGNVLMLTDGRSLEHRSAYNDFDQVVEEEDPQVDPGMANGYLRHFHYDANGNEVRFDVQNWKADSAGTPALEAGHPFFGHASIYDILDNRVESTEDATRDPAIPASSESESLTRRYDYDANENLIRVHSALAVDGSDPANRVVNIYDSLDRLIAKSRGAGSGDASTWSYTYDLNSNRTSHMDAVDDDGSGGPDARTGVYDGFDRLIKEIDRAGNEHRIERDPDGRRVEDEFRGPIDGSSPTMETLRRRHYLYDELGRLIQQDWELFLSRGVTTVHAVSLGEGLLIPADGRINRRFEYDAVGRQTFDVEDDGAVYGYEYDGANRRVRKTIPLSAPDTTPNDTVFVYDDNDNLVDLVETHVSPEGLVPPAVLTTRFVYDEVNRPVRLSDTMGQTLYFDYDSRSNLVGRYDQRGALMPDPLGLYTASDINGRGNGVRLDYDGASRPWRIVRKLHIDGEGDMPIDTSNPFVPTGELETFIEHDANDRAVRCTDGNGNTMSVDYDSLNRAVSQTNADGGVRTVTYDRDHRVVGATDENGTGHVFRYDALDRLERHELTLPGTTLPGTGLPMITGTTLRTFEYDGLSRLTRGFNNNDAGAGDDWVVDCRYDSMSRVVEEDQNGRTVGSSYDSDDRSDLHYPGASRVVHFEYDFHDQCTRITNPTSLQITMNYLGTCCPPIDLVSSVFVPGQLDVLSMTQTLNPVKLVVGSTWTTPGGTIGTQTVARGRDNQAEGQHLVYTAGVNSIDLTFDWTLSSIDQVIEQTRTEIVNGAPTAAFMEFTWGAAQELHEVSDGIVPILTNSFNSTYERTSFPFEYNAGGGAGTGIRTKDSTYVYQWNGMGGLESVRLASDPSTALAFFDYDAAPGASFEPYASGVPIVSEMLSMQMTGFQPQTGSKVLNMQACRRVEKFVTNSGGLNGGTRYYHDKDRVIEETDVVGMSEAVSRQFVHGYRAPDDVLAMDVDTNADGDPDALYFYARDFNNNTTHLVDSNGNPVELYTYDHLQVPTIYNAGTLGTTQASQAGNPFLFTGRRWEPETSLYFYRARYYDPVNGEFLSRDPLGFWGDGANLGNPMAYVGNNVWNFSDPSGQEVYWAARDTGAPIGNHHFIVCVPDNPEDFSDEDMVELPNGDKAIIVAGYRDSAGNLVGDQNKKPDVDATGESPEFGGTGGKGLFDWDTEVHLVGAPDGLTDTKFIKKLLKQYKNYKGHEKSHPHEFDLGWNFLASVYFMFFVEGEAQNCAAWANTMFYLAGVDVDVREVKGEFSGVDWGEQNYIPSWLFK